MRILLAAGCDICSSWGRRQTAGLQDGLKKQSEHGTQYAAQVEKANQAITDIQAKIDASEEAQKRRADEIEAKMNRLGLNTDEKA